MTWSAGSRRRRRARQAATTLGAAVLTAGLGVGLAGAGAGVSAAAAPHGAPSPTCSDSWTGGGGDGKWSTAANWSTGSVPGAADIACVTQNGTYTVTLDVDADVGGFSIGGTSGTQTVLITSDSNHLITGSASVIGTHGVVQLGNRTTCTGIECGAYLFDTANGNEVVTNNGKITSPASATGVAYLGVDLVNNGSITLNAPDNELYPYQNAVTLTNKGTVAIGATGTFNANSTGAFTASIDNTRTGSISNGGALTMNGNPSAVLTERGPVTGHVVKVVGITLDDDTSAQAAAFEVTGATVLSGSGAHPGIASGQKVTIDSNTVLLTLGTDVTNDGTLTVGSSGTGDARLQDVSGSPFVFTNDGTLTTSAASGGTDYLEAPVVNAGTVKLAAPHTIESDFQVPVTITNDNQLTLTKKATLTVQGNTASLTEGPAAVLTIANAVPTSKLSMINGNSVSLAGELKVKTTGTPSSGAMFTPIDVTSLSGTFGSESFGSVSYTVSYSPTSVTLTAS